MTPPSPFRLDQIAVSLAELVGTPLNVVRGHAVLLERHELAPNDADASAGTIVEQCDRITHVVRQLLGVACRDSIQPVATDLVELVTLTAHTLLPEALKNDVDVDLDMPPVLIAQADPRQMRRALEQLVRNALQACSPRGTVRVSLSRDPSRHQGSEEGLYWVLTVSDNGVGIPEEALPRLFEPFFTTRRRGEGVGLGLTLARAIVQDHGGAVEVTSRLGVGTRFDIYLPACEPRKEPWSDTSSSLTTTNPHES